MKLAATVALLLSLAQSQSQTLPTADPEILLIPSGYTGAVFIVFDIESGEPPRREGKARFYRIPRNGILLTQDKQNVGMNVVQQFYFESPSGGRETIPRNWSNSIADNPDQRAHLVIEAMGHGRLDETERGCSFAYQNFFIGARRETMFRENAQSRDALFAAVRNLPSCPALVPPKTPPPSPEPARPMIEQQLTMVFGLWTRGEPPLRLHDFDMVKLLLPTDEYALQRALPGGLLEIVGGDGRPIDDPARPRVFLIFTGRLSQHVRLAIPKDGTTIYVQREDTFDRIPPDPPLLNQFVDLTPEPNLPGVVGYMADKGGYRSGGSISLPRP